MLNLVLIFFVLFLTIDFYGLERFSYWDFGING